MAWRGRGRGRGRGGGGFGGFAKPEEHVLFPQNVKLPDIDTVTEEIALVSWNSKLQSYWRSSPYYLEEPSSKKNQNAEIERYSDRRKPRNRAERNPLSCHLKLTPSNFPQELIEGKERMQHDQRKVLWNPESDLLKFDKFEKLEQIYKDQDDKVGKNKKEGEDEDGDEEEIDAEDEEYSDDGDYNQNVDFDDDEDDFNMDDGIEDEPTY